jgi:imidazole glycerol-phosphate synthase subunit HisH
MNEKNIIHIPNLSLGNTKSVVNMVNRIGGKVIIANSPEELMEAKKIILPGVGSYDIGMKELHDGNWVVALNKLVIEQQVPILGICLGMQFFFNKSEEGVASGLGWIPGYLKKFVSEENNPIKIPHMGWNAVNILRQDGIFPANVDEELRYYFVHSYHAICENKEDLVANAFHGSNVTAAVQNNNIYGVQFHPEKSHRFGMDLLRNYLSV